MSDFFNEKLMTEDEHGDWYKDPRIWVVVLALLMFFFTMIKEGLQKVFILP